MGLSSLDDSIKLVQTDIGANRQEVNGLWSDCRNSRQRETGLNKTVETLSTRINDVSAGLSGQIEDVKATAIEALRASDEFLGSLASKPSEKIDTEFGKSGKIVDEKPGN